MLKNRFLLKSLTASNLFPFAGDKTIEGRTMELGEAIPARIRLYEKSTGRLISDIASNSNGEYIFKNLAAVSFFTVTHHPKNQFNAVIQDNVVPK